MNFDHIPSVQGIYKITNTTSQFFYIGSSQNVRTRLKEHFYRLRKQTHSNKHLQRVFDLCGDSIFSLELVENCSGITKDELLDVEQRYLDSITDWRLCYNQTRPAKAADLVINKALRNLKERSRVLQTYMPLVEKSGRDWLAYIATTVDPIASLVATGQDYPEAKKGDFL
jgi:group I intron endonuclease